MINIEKQIQLYKSGYNLEIINLLLNLNSGINIQDYISLNSKFDNVYKTCERKNLVFEGKLTQNGLDLIQFLDKPNDIKFEKKKIGEEDFLKWWDAYPKSDGFTYKGKTFNGSRGLRIKKEDCRIKITSILQEGEYTIDDLIRALQYEVNQKVERSYKEGKNIMSYMQGSLTYLNQRTYENFMEVSKQKVEEKHTFNGVDI